MRIVCQTIKRVLKMKTIRKCRFCGKEFVARNGMQKFCCEECQTMAEKARKKRQQDFMNAVERLGAYMVDGGQLTMGELLQYDGQEDWESLRQRLWFKPRQLNTDTDPYETADMAMESMNNVYSLEYRDYYGQPLSGGDRWAYVYQWYADGEFCRGSVFEVVFKESADGTGGDTNEGAGIEHFDAGTTAMYATSEILTSLFGDDIRKEFTIHHQGNTPDGEIWQGGEGRHVSLKWYTPKKDRPQYAGDNGRNRRIMRLRRGGAHAGRSPQRDWRPLGSTAEAEPLQGTGEHHQRQHEALPAWQLRLRTRPDMAGAPHGAGLRVGPLLRPGAPEACRHRAPHLRSLTPQQPRPLLPRRYSRAHAHT